MMQEKYEIEGKTFWIYDDELELNLEGQLEFLESDTYPNGQVRFETYRKDDKLHGPSYFYGKNGRLLSEAWFFEGVAEGKVKRYYPSGDSYCIERYVGGVLHLLQEYFYLDGSIKTQIPYNRGRIDGTVFLFWPDGTQKRESVYEKDTLLRDVFYNEQGNEIFETARSLS